MRGWGIFGLALLLSACSPDGSGLREAGAAPISVNGIWSASGVLLRGEPVSSPDGRFTLAWSDRGLAVSGASNGVLSSAIPDYPAPEILWSPGNDRVAITWSDGGAVGTWQVDAYDLSAGAPRDLHVSHMLAPDPTLRIVHDRGNLPNNIAAIAWLEDGAGLLVVSEWPARRTGEGDVKPKGLLLSFSEDRVVGTIKGDALAKTWGSLLGPRPLAADAD